MLIRILIPLVILLVGGFFAYHLAEPVEPPTPEQVPEQRLKTEVAELNRTDYPVLLDSQGVIRAHHETTLTPSVSGTVVMIGLSFEDGAFFEENEVLLELDPADFRATLATADSQLARAEAALAQEQARARQARLNWQDLGYETEPSDLVLRVPQLKEAQAGVDAAVAALDKAKLDLERTKVRAPFDGRVRARLIGLGQSVGDSTALGEIFATDLAEVRLPLTPDQLAFIDLPSRPGDPEVRVTLTDALVSSDLAEPASWQARIVRAEGALDEASRELFAIARIDDPFGRESGAPPLRLGQPVRASIEGRVLEDVFVVPRQALRGLDVIYLVKGDDPAIARTNVEPIWSTQDVMVIDEGLENGDLLSITRLPYAPNGAPVEIPPPPASASTAAERTDS